MNTVFRCSFEYDENSIDWIGAWQGAWGASANEAFALVATTAIGAQAGRVEGLLQVLGDAQRCVSQPGSK